LLSFQDSTNDITDGNNVILDNYWSPNTQYNITLDLDFDNEQFDLIINGTTEATGVSFTSSSPEFNQFQIVNTTWSSGVERTIFVDDVEEGFITFSAQQTDVSSEEDISEIATDKNIKMRVNLSRANTSNNPTVDFLQRRWLR
jgi:hypothetical protein